MRSRGKEVLAREDAPESAQLDTALSAISPDLEQRMREDLHLIRAALTTDCLVVSCDEKARRVFRNAAREIRELRPIAWINPEAEGAVTWLKRGAKSQPELRLWNPPGQRARSESEQ